jgi:hypothetical protein
MHAISNTKNLVVRTKAGHRPPLTDFYDGSAQILITVHLSVGCCIHASTRVGLGVAENVQV